MNVEHSGQQGRGRRIRRKTAIVLIPLILILVLAAWRFNWFGSQPGWARTTGWSRIPMAEQARETSGELDATHPGWPALHWLGHAGFILDWQGTRLLLDPNDAEWVTLSRRRMEHPVPPSRWGDIDAALISHGHRDHLVPETLAAVPVLRRILLPAGSELYVEGVRGPETTITGLRVHEPVTVGALEIIAVPAAHNGDRRHPWRSARKAFGYVVRAGGVCLYFAGDTALGNDFAGIRDRYHPDLALLPIGAFAPRIPFKIHHLSPEEAVQAAVALGVKAVIPCHFGTFTLTLDYPSTALPRFAQAARAAGVEWVLPEFLSRDI